MYLLHAPEKKFGNIPPNTPCVSPEVRFTNNYAYTNKYYWKKVHCDIGCIDITPKEIIKLRLQRKLKSAVFIVKGGIGDCLWAMPAVKRFKELNPNCYTYIITEAKTKEIWINSQFINGFAEDNIWNTQQVIMRAEEVYNFGGVATIYKKQMKKDPVEAIFNEMNLAIQKEYSKMRPCLTLTADEGRQAKEFLRTKNIIVEDDKIITIGIDASTSNRHYPLDYIREVSKALIERNFKVIWLGKTDEYREDVIKKEKKVNGVCNLVSKTNLRNVMAIIALSDLHINPNSGLMVIATALNIPTIGLFGAFEPKIRTKFYEKFEALYSPTNCSPCNEHWTECRHGHPAPCMKNIRPSVLYKKSLEILRKYERKLIEKMPIE